MGNKITIQASDEPKTNGNAIQKVNSQIKALSLEVSGLGLDFNSLVSKLDNRYLRKTFPDTAFRTIEFNDNAIFKDGFKTSGARQGSLTGTGGLMFKNEDGSTTFEVDYINIRRSMFVNELIINQARHSGGINITSAGNLIISRIEYLSGYSEILGWIGNTDFIRCYFDNNLGQTYNTLVVGDVVLCKRMNIANEYFPSKYYRKRVIQIGIDYVDLEMYGIGDTNMIEVGDNLVQWGHLWDFKRQSIIEINTLEGGRQSFFRDMGNCRASINDSDLPYDELPLEAKRTLWQSPLWQYDTDKNTIDIGYIFDRDMIWKNMVSIKGDFRAGSSGNWNYIEYDSRLSKFTINADLNIRGQGTVEEVIDGLKEDISSAGDNTIYIRGTGAYSGEGNVNGANRQTPKVIIKGVDILDGYRFNNEFGFLFCAIKKQDLTPSYIYDFHYSETPEIISSILNYMPDHIIIGASNILFHVFPELCNVLKKLGLGTFTTYGTNASMCPYCFIGQNTNDTQGVGLESYIYPFKSGSPHAEILCTVKDGVISGASDYDYVKNAINVGSASISGGLTLTNLLATAPIGKTEDIYYARAGISGIDGDNVAFFAHNYNAYNVAKNYALSLSSEKPNFLVTDKGEVHIKGVISTSVVTNIQDRIEINSGGTENNIKIFENNLQKLLISPSKIPNLKDLIQPNILGSIECYGYAELNHPPGTEDIIEYSSTFTSGSINILNDGFYYIDLPSVYYRIMQGNEGSSGVYIELYRDSELVQLLLKIEFPTIVGNGAYGGVNFPSRRIQVEKAGMYHIRGYCGMHTMVQSQYSHYISCGFGFPADTEGTPNITFRISSADSISAQYSDGTWWYGNAINYYYRKFGEYEENRMGNYGERMGVSNQPDNIFSGYQYWNGSAWVNRTMT